MHKMTMNDDEMEKHAELFSLLSHIISDWISQNINEYAIVLSACTDVIAKVYASLVIPGNERSFLENEGIPALREAFEKYLNKKNERIEEN